MITLAEYFNSDFKDLCISSDLNIVTEKNELTVNERVYQDMDSSVRFFTYYIPNYPQTIDIIYFLINNIPKRIQDYEKAIDIRSSIQGDIVVGQYEYKYIYSNRIYFYIETQLSNDNISNLEFFCKGKNICITIRSTEYFNKKMEREKPLAFISYDSRDKNIIAKPLADGLAMRYCHVWYDEYSLKIGDSLRTSIEEGIKNAKKCILILTKNYISNPGWSKKEFNSIFTRELICNEKIILPIWYDLTPTDIYKYSPSLADTVALKWPDKKSMEEEIYKKEIAELISKVHIAITSSQI